MRKLAQTGAFWRRAMRALAIAPVLLFLWLFTFAASQELHAALHADAGHSDHHCAITVLAQSQLESPSCAIFVFIAVKDVNHTLPVCLSVPGNGVELLPPGRAPPVVFA